MTKEKLENISRLTELKQLIKNAPARIEAEFKRTANDWLSCFGTTIFQIETYLTSPKLQNELGAEKYRTSLEKIEKLKNQLLALKEQFPNKLPGPPDNIKKELLKQLNIF